MYYTTPLLFSPFFDQPVLLKMECSQPSGSFKSRGMTNLIANEAQGYSECHVYACSAGNAGLAAAEAAHKFGIPCTVVVPKTTKPRMRNRICKMGAQVVVHGKCLPEAENHCENLIAEAKNRNEKTIYCHPFDNPLIWEGHSSMVLEIMEQIKQYQFLGTKPAAIVLSCGGGGLYLGVMTGLEKVGWAQDVPVVVVETEGAPTFSESLSSGEIVRLSTTTTIAYSLACTYVPNQALKYAKKYGSRSVLVTDLEAVNAGYRFASDHGTIIEPACAATLAAIYRGDLVEYANQGPVVAIVCGGTNYGPEDLRAASKL